MGAASPGGRGPRRASSLQLLASPNGAGAKGSGPGTPGASMGTTPQGSNHAPGGSIPAPPPGGRGEASAFSPTAGATSHGYTSIFIRLLLLAVLLASVGIGVFFYMVNGPAQQQAVFLAAYSQIVDRLSVALPAALNLQETAMDVLQGPFLFLNGSYPTFPEFYYIASTVVTATSSLAAGFAPAIAGPDRAAFEASLPDYAPLYATEPIMNASAALGIWQAAQGDLASWPRTSSSPVARAYSPDRSGLYFPVLYVAPTVNNQWLFLFDLYSQALQRTSIDKCLLYSGSYTTDMLYFGSSPGAAALRPVYVLPQRTLLGLVYVPFLWERLLLSDGGGSTLSGIDVAIQAPSGASFTFRLGGAYPVAKGKGLVFDSGMDGATVSFRLMQSASSQPLPAPFFSA